MGQLATQLLLSSKCSGKWVKVKLAVAVLRGGKVSSLFWTSVSQTMVRGPPMVLEICPCGPSKRIEEKVEFK